MKSSGYDSVSLTPIGLGDGETMSTDVRLFFDIYGLQEQLHQLSTLLEKTPVNSRKRASELAFGYLEQLDSDVLVSQHVTTPGAHRAVNFLFSVLFGAEFERLLCALRTIEFNGS